MRPTRYESTARDMLWMTWFVEIEYLIWFIHIYYNENKFSNRTSVFCSSGSFSTFFVLLPSDLAECPIVLINFKILNSHYFSTLFRLWFLIVPIIMWQLLPPIVPISVFCLLTRNAKTCRIWCLFCWGVGFISNYTFRSCQISDIIVKWELVDVSLFSWQLELYRIRQKPPL